MMCDQQGEPDCSQKKKRKQLKSSVFYTARKMAFLI